MTRTSYYSHTLSNPKYRANRRPSIVVTTYFSRKILIFRAKKSTRLVGVLLNRAGQLLQWYGRFVRRLLKGEPGMKSANLFRLLSMLILIVTGCRKNTGETTPALHQAAEEGNIEQIQSLIAGGVDINAPDSYGQTALERAAFEGRASVVELFLFKGARVNTRNRYGRTPLHVAAMRDFEDVARLLLAAGAEVDAKNDQGLTPLHIAVLFGRKDVAALLIARGASLEAGGREGHTSLSLAIREGHTQVAELLRKHGAKEQ